ncbi:hypothetical protein [Nocardioides yefusunii]|uniref:DUF11 domain-containing protein n=1 Tax=Nocardioides yefusunii TaxID=2500546 RepID=A0ABW1QTX9_9ACTN|nr:hypothetical protein [Nocardioides yefusunii]
MPTSMRSTHARPSVRSFPRTAPVIGNARLDVLSHGLDLWGTPGRGEFVFSVSVRNSGTEAASNLHVALEIPHACGVTPDHTQIHTWGPATWLSDALAPASGWRFTRPGPLEPGETTTLEVRLRVDAVAPRMPEDAVVPVSARVRSTSASNRPTIPLWINLT